MRQPATQLQDFNTQSLVQIVRGVESATEALKDSSAIISPTRLSADQEGMRYVLPNMRQTTQMIEFDVAVYASEGSEQKGGIGIAIASIALGATEKKGASSSSESRLKFSVPLVLPDGAPSADDS